MRKPSITTLAAVASVAMLAGPAFAQTATDTFVVSITVEQDCAILTEDLDFGTVNDLTPPIDGITTGTVTCTGTTPVSVSFDVGTGGGSFATRLMALNGDTIAYNLYRDAAHTEILGDGTSGTFTIDFTSTGGADPFSVFGQTGADQNPKPPGTYTSTITSTVTF